MAATNAERNAMAKAEASLLTQLEAAELYAAKVKGKLFLSAAEQSVLKNIADERARFNTWRSTWRQWALDGYNPKEKLAYPVNFWLRIGGDIASALKLYAGALYDASPLQAVVEAVKETGKDVATIATPSAWPPWAKGLAIVAGIAVVIITINNAAAIARSLRGAS